MYVLQFRPVRYICCYNMRKDTIIGVKTLETCSKRIFRIELYCHIKLPAVITCT